MERKELQRRCAELRKYLPAGAKCSHSTQLLRQYVTDAERTLRARNLPVVPFDFTTPKATGPGFLVNDLVELIAWYSNQTVTERIGTLSPDLASRTLYKTAFWKQKLLVDWRGVIFNDAVVNGADINPLKEWHSYYRISNRFEYGTPGVLTKKGELVRLPITNATGFAINNIGTLVHVYNAAKWYIYRIHPKGQRVSELMDTINLSGVTRALSSVTNGSYAITERGELHQYHRKKLAKLLDNIIDIREVDTEIRGHGLRRATVSSSTNIRRSYVVVIFARLSPWPLTEIYIFDRAKGWIKEDGTSIGANTPGTIIWFNDATAQAYTADGNVYLKQYLRAPYFQYYQEWRAGIPVVLFSYHGSYREETLDIFINGVGGRVYYQVDPVITTVYRMSTEQYYAGTLPAVRCFTYTTDNPPEVPYLLLVDGSVWYPRRTSKDPILRINTLPHVKMLDARRDTVVVMT